MSKELNYINCKLENYFHVCFKFKDKEKNKIKIFFYF